MKTLFWGLLCGIGLAFGPVAHGDDSSAKPSVQPQPAASADLVCPSELKALWPVSAAPTHREKLPGVPNFGKLNAQIWRSGQTNRTGYRHLAASGLKTVINLRSEFAQDKNLLPEGVKYVSIPIRNDHAPTEAQARQLLDTVKDPANWPILIHCAAGEGRTGTMCALIRHSLDGWDHAAIMEEVGNYWRRLRPGKSPMVRCQENYIGQWEATPSLLAHP